MPPRTRHSILSFCRRHWPGLVRIADRKSLFFTTVERPADIRLNRQIVEMNYGNLSPWPDFTLLFQVQDDLLLLWFFPGELIGADPFAIALPTGCLLQYAAPHKRSVLYRCREGDTTEFILIGDNRLRAHLIRNGGRDSLQEIAQNLARKHRIDDLATEEISPATKAELLEQGLRAMPPGRLEGFLLRGRGGATALARLTRTCTLALFLFLAAYFGIAGVALYLSGRQLAGLEQEAASLRGRAAPLLRQRETLEKDVVFWQTFFSKEMRTPSPDVLLAALATAILRQKGHLVSLTVNRDEATFRVVCEDAAGLLATLQQSDLFRELRFNSAIVKQKKDGMQQASLHGILRAYHAAK